MDKSSSMASRPGLYWYLGGGALVVAAVVLFTIDADPAFLFQSPVASLVIGGAGLALAFVGYRTSLPSEVEP